MAPAEIATGVVIGRASEYFDFFVYGIASVLVFPTVGVDYYIWALQISGLGTLLTGVNFVATIFKMRAPGMRAG